MTPLDLLCSVLDDTVPLVPKSNLAVWARVRLARKLAHSIRKESTRGRKATAPVRNPKR